jgi:hypothetical protein
MPPLNRLPYRMGRRARNGDTSRNRTRSALLPARLVGHARSVRTHTHARTQARAHACTHTRPQAPKAPVACTAALARASGRSSRPCAAPSKQRAVGSVKRAVGSVKRAVGSVKRAVGSVKRAVGSVKRAVGSVKRAGVRVCGCAGVRVCGCAGVRCAHAAAAMWRARGCGRDSRRAVAGHAPADLEQIPLHTFVCVWGGGGGQHRRVGHRCAMHMGTQADAHRHPTSLATPPLPHTCLLAQRHTHSNTRTHERTHRQQRTNAA